MHTALKSRKRMVAKNSRQWIAYFKSNCENLLKIPWGCKHQLTPLEKDSISRSMSIFQLGESSEGKRLRALASKWAHLTSNTAFSQAIDYFIREEQRHACDLARFLSRENIPLRKIHWTDLLFRFLRRFWNLETCLSVLLTAELVAKIYYRALRKATASPVLQTICTQLLKDEVHHLYFHAQNLAALQKNRNRFSIRVWSCCYRLFYELTLCVVWIGHRKVFAAAQYSFIRFWRESQKNAQRILRTLPALRRDADRASAAPAWRRKKLQFQTSAPMEFLDVTDQVAAIVLKSRVKTGIVNIQTQHTTTGLMINENEPLLLKDIRAVLEKMAPECHPYLHNDFSIRTVNMQPFEEKNGHAHCRALFLRSSESIHIVKGALALGRWQRLFFIECDRARQRTVEVMIFGQ